MTVFESLQMPSLDGATEWLNSEPLGPAELSGHVVLVNFWTLTCINWLRQAPYILPRPVRAHMFPTSSSPSMAHPTPIRRSHRRSTWQSASTPG
jgi:hypothetical protein